eukprot:TRINITY_DN2074_c1_g1_i1.p1 TRINITY_DN2074_c1_g1~~TRINITY_DN2074_c1_g1_i1.p1  ORF type:complete len:288 (+),score=48.52 TRINITY_DN2074_c1_g1_i1:764-1627(+)
MPSGLKDTETSSSAVGFVGRANGNRFLLSASHVMKLTNVANEDNYTDCHIDRMTTILGDMVVVLPNNPIFINDSTPGFPYPDDLAIVPLNDDELGEIAGIPVELEWNGSPQLCHIFAFSPTFNYSQASESFLGEVDFPEKLYLALQKLGVVKSIGVCGMFNNHYDKQLKGLGYHRISEFRGFSGAPVIIHKDGTLVAVGVHLGEIKIAGNISEGVTHLLLLASPRQEVFSLKNVPQEVLINRVCVPQCQRLLGKVWFGGQKFWVKNHFSAFPVAVCIAIFRQFYYEI